MTSRILLTAVLPFLFALTAWGQSDQTQARETGAGQVDIQWNDATRPDLFRPDPVLLARYVGVWESTDEGKDGTKWREEWAFKWNPSHTFLDYRTVVERNGEPFSIGAGFLMYDVKTATYRLYLMVDNGALHESIGKETVNGRFEYTMETYGNPKFATTTGEGVCLVACRIVSYSTTHRKEISCHAKISH